jgi:cytochrome c peroxidase
VNDVLATRIVLPIFLATLSTGCSQSHGSSATKQPLALSAQAKLGRQLFFDASLSASGTTSCATCHDPQHGFAQAADQGPVPRGGRLLDVAGTRNAPSLRYLAWTPPFSLEVKDGKTVPTGGFTRDGRVNTLAQQARLPLLAPHEMANNTAAEFAAKLSRASYAAQFRAVFGEHVLDDPEAALARATFALQQFQLEDTETFAPFTSKYDFFLRGVVALSEQEQRGLALFEDPEKGNCAACHPSKRSDDGTLPLFTDFTYDNIGVPRNRTIPANADAGYFDLGLCGPLRTDLSRREEFCGAFKVPTLRNIALTAPYLHNGRFATLQEVVDFYVTRDTDPQKWYGAADDPHPGKFDDLPSRYAANVNTKEVPYDRHPGDAPALSPSEIDDVVAFLQTLTDGYQR